MIQLQARNTLAVGEHSWLGQCAQLSAVNKGFQDVLLDIVVVVDYVASLRRSSGRFSTALLTP